MDYIEKLNLQTEEVKEVETLEKHTIINNEPFSVNKYNGHTRDFLALDGDYNDGFKQLKEVDGLGVSCIVSKEVKEARQDVNGNVHTRLKDRIDIEVNDIKSSLETITKQNDSVIYANNDTLSLQTLINNANGKPIKISKTYEINEPIICPNNLKLYSDKFMQGKIKAISEMECILQFENVSRSEIMDIEIIGNDMANCGIKVNGIIEHSLIEKCYITGTKVNAIYIKDGWCNTIKNNEITNNLGNGIELDTTISNNINNILENRIYHNEGIGIKSNFSNCINITKNTIEQNKICGIFACGSVGMNIKDNYFEGNSVSGWNNYKVDIVLNGEYSNNISKLYPNKNVTIEDNTTSFDGILSATHVLPICVDGLKLKSNARTGTTDVSLFTIINDITKTITKNFDIGGNNNFTDYVCVGDYTNKDNRQDTHTWSISGINKNNIYSKAYTELTELFHNKGSILESSMFYNGKKGFCITGIDDNSYSTVWGFDLDLSEYPELKDKYITFSCICLSSNDKICPVLYINGFNTHYGWISNEYNQTYKIVSTHYKLPNSGIIKIGFGTMGNDNSATCHFFEPTIMVTGNKISN